MINSCNVLFLQLQLFIQTIAMVHMEPYTYSLKYIAKMYPSYVGYKISVDQTRKECFIQLDIKKRESCTTMLNCKGIAWATYT